MKIYILLNMLRGIILSPKKDYKKIPIDYNFRYKVTKLESIIRWRKYVFFVDQVNQKIIRS